MNADLGAFLTLSAVVIVTPGQDTALTIRNALAGGARGGIFTALGVAAGQAVWVLASAAGLTALLLASAAAFTILKLAGAAYLIFLGARSLFEALAPRARYPQTPAPSRSPSLAPAVAFRQGLVSALGNPKLAVFFVSLLPQFVPSGPASLAALLVLGATFCAMTLVWLSGYAAVIGKSGDLLGHARVRRAVQAALGVVLVAFGLKLAVEHR